MFGFGKKSGAELGVFGGEGSMTEREFLEKEIERWKVSPGRKMMITGQLYYEGEQDILLRKRTAIGQGGQLEEIENLPNNRVVDNQYAKLVNQKADYLLGQPFVVRGDNAEYVKMLKKVFNKGFMKTLKNVGKGVLNWGIAWIYPYLDAEEGICVKIIPGYEVLPFWKDSEMSSSSVIPHIPANSLRNEMSSMLFRPLNTDRWPYLVTPVSMQNRRCASRDLSEEKKP